MLSNDIQTALFPVELRRVSVDLPSGPAELNDFRAVVDMETSRVFAIVSPTYTLITNAVAIEQTKACFREVFGAKADSEFVCRQVMMPSTRSFCHLDFFLRDRYLALNRVENDLWQPYVRITNSYNRTRSLRIDLGYYRVICSNGAIFRSRGIEIEYVHNRKSGKLTQNLKHGFKKAFEKLESEFQSSLYKLHQFEFERKYVWPLFCKTFEINSVDPKDCLDHSIENQYRAHQQKHDLITRLTDHYFHELGDNAYAVFNIFTDYASRPPVASPHLQIDGLQSRCGQWISSFAELISTHDFMIESYLDEYLSLAS